MISRDALRYLRSVNQRQLSQYVCPFCTSRAISSTSTKSTRSIKSRTKSSGCLNRPKRSYATASSVRRQPSLESSTPSPADDLPPLGPGTLPLVNGNVREYLKRWAQEYEEEQDRVGNELMKPTRTASPNSLFIRDISALDEMKEDGINADLEDTIYDLISEDQDEVVSIRRTLNPGDVFVVLAPEVRRQIALHLGYVGQQHQLLLQNGRWWQGMVTDTYGEVIPKFATVDEVNKIKTALPKSTINAADSAGFHGMTAYGDVPSSIGATFATRFRRVQTEYDAFCREHVSALDRLYPLLVDESDYKSLNLNIVTRQYMGFELDSAPAGARLALLDKFFNDARYTILVGSAEHTLIITPMHIFQAGKAVAGWARDYQDAAARASAGKDVLPELRSNPLTQFIAKSRRLVSKSRKIRSFDDDLVPTLTFPDQLPPDGGIERKPSGELFTEQDKHIIKLIWDTYVRTPSIPPRATTVLSSTIALVLRAVGAYPNHKLDTRVATLFLQELGCIDPWSNPGVARVTLQVSPLGNNQNMKIVQQREEKAMKDLDILGTSRELTLPDTMAAIRKDWGDLEAFAVDPPTTRVVDDAFSIEPSAENPGHSWIHVHIAHPAAFIPPHHDLLSRPEYMGAAYYGSGRGSRPFLPFTLLDKLSLSDKKSNQVMTVSTLLSNDGSVKDVEVTVGTLRNVIKIDRDFHLRATRVQPPVQSRFRLEVGSKASGPDVHNSVADERSSEWASHVTDQTRLIDQHRSKFDLVDTLLRNRFEARKRETPDHLRAFREPARAVLIKVRTGVTDETFDRLFRSEHCYGDPHITLSKNRDHETTTYADYPELWGSLYQMRNLAMESFALWTRERQIPVIYGVAKPTQDFPLEKLNNLTRYDRYDFPISGASLQPGPHVLLNLRQTMNASTPLRQYTDLVNQYQISAYIQAQASAGNNTHGRHVKVNYPYSEADLNRCLRQRISSELTRAENLWNRHWIMQAFHRAWRDQQDGFPKLFDARVQGNRSPFVSKRTIAARTAYLYPWPIKGVLTPTEQGYELSARPTQFLPVKIVTLDPLSHKIDIIAVGPASDEPNFPENFVSLNS